MRLREVSALVMSSEMPSNSRAIGLCNPVPAKAVPSSEVQYLTVPSKQCSPAAEQQGLFIAYPSVPGCTASDQGDKSGPYAATLA
jgi:hypothetical protein